MYLRWQELSPWICQNWVTMSVRKTSVEMNSNWDCLCSVACFFNNEKQISKFSPNKETKHSVFLSLPLTKLFSFSCRARFHYERGMEYSLFVLLIFALLSARLDFRCGKIKKSNKECSIPRS